MKPKVTLTTEVINPKTSISYEKGAIISKQILKKHMSNVTLFAVDEGEGLNEHTAPCDTLVSVLDGAADVIINGRHYVLQKGNSIIMPANIPHALHATERFKMLMTLIKNE